MTIRLEFVIPDVQDRIDEDYVELKIERDPGGGFVEISHATTRPPLRGVVERYVYQDPTGDTAWSYQATLIKADGTPYGTPYAADVVEKDAYTTLAAIRKEGVLATDVDDDTVEEYIELATRYIEDYCLSWFVPRYQCFEVTGEGLPRLFLDIPIIALQKITMNDEEENIETLEVNNRYLRNGLTSPDDRKNPMITYSDGYLVDEGTRLYSLGGGHFPKDRQETKIWGIFGFTELARGAVCGETANNSQVPLEYGGVPALIEWCARMITVNRCYPALSDESIAVILKNRITRQKTRDQEVEFADPESSENTNTNGFTNSTIIDQILERFKRPLQMKFV